MSSTPLQIYLVADESVDATIIKALRDKKYIVWSISEETPSVSDTIVLETAFQKETILLTEDKDFGELVIRLKKPHHGILLIRLSGMETNEKAAIVVNTIQKHFTELKKSFSVLDPNKLRIKTG